MWKFPYLIYGFPYRIYGLLIVVVSSTHLILSKWRGVPVSPSGLVAAGRLCQLTPNRRKRLLETHMRPSRVTITLSRGRGACARNTCSLQRHEGRKKALSLDGCSVVTEVGIRSPIPKTFNQLMPRCQRNRQSSGPDAKGMT